MKKLNIILILLFIISSCTETDLRDDNNYNGDEQTYFSQKNLNKEHTVSMSSNPIIKIAVGSTITSSSSRSYTVTVDASSTSIAGLDYEVPATLTIAAGEFVGEIELNTKFDTMQDYSVLVLNLEASGSMVSTFKNQMSVTFAKECDPATYVSSLAGSTTLYTVVTTYSAHDFLDDYPSYTLTDVSITDLGENMFQVNDFSGGLYGPDGKYDDEYGTGGTDNTLTFKDFCNQLSWEGQSDPWGAINMQDATNSINPINGVITISWTCTGYGETGVSVYTPQN